MQFTKWHGAGNDYVYVNLLRQPELARHPDVVQPAELAIEISDRRRGIGADGLVFVMPSKLPDAAARMRMFNADGSEGEMCGNALRCVGRLLANSGDVSTDDFGIETGRGLLHVWVGDQVRVEMGPPILAAAEIPTRLSGTPLVDVSLIVGDREFSVTCVSMGNPHCVVFSEDLTDDLVLRYGPQIENHPAFPNRTNVEFVTATDRSNLNVRVWERGSGETAACGTGACAAVVAGALTQRCERTAAVKLPGGILEVAWQPDGNILLAGPTAEVFRGEWPLQP